MARYPRLPVPSSRQVTLVVAVFVIVTVAWELGVRLSGIPVYILPPPSRIVSQLIIMTGQRLFWRDVVVTMQEVALGYGLALVLALLQGAAIAQVGWMELAFMPYIVAFQTIPSVALAPLFLQWFGYGLLSKVVMAALIAFFPILVNVIAGLKASRPEEIQMVRAFGATRWQILRTVKVPNSLPYVFAGLELGIVFALVGAIVAEFVGAKAGLGNRILQYNEQFNIAGMFGVLLMLAVMGMGLHHTVTAIKRRALYWVDTHTTQH